MRGTTEVLLAGMEHHQSAIAFAGLNRRTSHPSKVMKLNIALLQMIGCGFDKDAGRIKGERFCRLAKTSGADVAFINCLPIQP
jgi:hypothetical protein